MSSRVWLITGTNSGLGLALAEHVLSQGDKVIATVRNIAKLPASLKSVSPLELDLNSSPEDIKAVGLKALEIYGHVDVLVNNAGYGIEVPMEELSPTELVTQFQANFFSAVYLIQSLLPAFRARKSGTVLNISSIASTDPAPALTAYSASKAALDAMSEALAQELTPWGIRIFIVQPGFFLTNWHANATSIGAESRRAAEESRKTGVYADLHGCMGRTLHGNLTVRQVGDPRRAAHRMYDVVTGTGLVEGLQIKGGCPRILLGRDSGERFLEKVQALQENAESTKTIWSATDLDPVRVEEMRKEAGIH
ncbi:hypothetical protein HETIRDRAFT_324012 [Heterobasidion irregulare TC 32-1]|uniref:Ketoreductase domain-containing protein n=1 Tax=Heterobasidion irregulare (strain TC 32-1) TaxID=747525 RepID=W4JZ49_HETIT|nr:uncharacterized protein HETIRDRAFT_324012 [Heterobasidion irregulare TC 32-1]ETW78843.1 hypothetical protein HETIRDRAFT_324012 [Heterobasidion irregulare TC 32-1]